MKVIKRDGRVVSYDSNKISIAISKANAEVPLEDRISNKQINNIIKYIESLDKKRMLVEDIQDVIEKKLMEFKKYNLAKKYVIYRYTRALVRKSNSSDEFILNILKNNRTSYNDFVNLACQRGIIASSVASDLAKRILLPSKIVSAIEDGVLYFNDLDYFMQPMFNSSNINVSDMFLNGTIVNNIAINNPKNFIDTCCFLASIIHNISYNQYGSVTCDISFLEKYCNKKLDENALLNEIKMGLRILLYQINTFSFSNSNFKIYFLINFDNMEFNKIIYEELFNLIINNGFSNPNIIFYLNENNNFTSGKYDYLTELTGKIKNVLYVSSLKIKSLYKGEVCFAGEQVFPLFKYENRDVLMGRFNQGFVTINLAQIGFLSKDDINYFWKLFDERLEICKESLMCKYYALLGNLSSISPILYMNGAISRLDKDDKIDKLLKNGYSTLSLSFSGLNVLLSFLKKDKAFAYDIIKHMHDKCLEWSGVTGICFNLYKPIFNIADCELKNIDGDLFDNEKFSYSDSFYDNSFSSFFSGGFVKIIDNNNFKESINDVYQNVLCAKIDNGGNDK